MLQADLAFPDVVKIQWCLLTGNNRINIPLNIPKGNILCPGGGIREQVRDSWQTIACCMFQRA